MYLLFEIPDKYIVIFGVIVFILLLVMLCIFFAIKKKNKVKPIEEKDRFEPEVSFKKVEELTDEQKKAREELERVFNQMNDDLQKEKENVVDSFEREQEENAIISYQELIKQVQKRENTAEKEEVKVDDFLPEKEEVKNDNYLEATFEKEPSINLSHTEERKPYAGEKTKFNASEIISPIFGRQEPLSNDNYKSETKDNLEDEQKQNEEFLNTLKEFRNNL